MTPGDDALGGLLHADPRRDNFFARTCYAYKALGLTPVCPLHRRSHRRSTATNPNLVENLGDPPSPAADPRVQPRAGATDGGGDIYHQSTTPQPLDRQGGRRHHAVAHPRRRLELGPRRRDRRRRRPQPRRQLPRHRQRGPTRQRPQRHRRRVRPDVRDGTPAAPCRDARAHARRPGGVRRVHAGRRPHLRREHDRDRDHHRGRRGAERQRPRPPGQRVVQPARAAAGLVQQVRRGRRRPPTTR